MTYPPHPPIPPHPPTTPTHATDPFGADLQPPSPPRRSAAGEFISWGIIIALTLFIAGTTFLTAYFPSSTAPATAAQTPDFELRLASRYLLGARQLSGASSGMMDNAVRSTLAPYLKPAASEFDSVRAAIAVGELLGPETALEELDNLQARAEHKPFQDAGTPDDIAALRALYLGETLDPDQQQRLIDRHAWFGELASTYARPDTDPARAQIFSGSIRTVVALLAFGSLAFLAFLAGLVLFILLIIALKNRRIMFRLPRDLASLQDQRLTPYLGVMAGFFVVFIALSHLYPIIPPVAGVQIGQFILWGALLAVLVPTLFGTPWHDLRKAIGWHTGEGVLREMGAGVLGYITLLPIAGLGILMMLALNAIGAQYGLEAQPHPAAGEISAKWSVAVPLYLLACVWAPIVEETMFRGAFYRYLRGSMRPVAAALAQGFLFAVIHPQGILTVPALMALGFNFAIIREWRGSLIGPMTAHALNNGFVFTMLLFAIG